MNIGNSEYWYSDKIGGAKFGGGDNGGVYSDVGAEVGSGDDEGVK